MSDNNFVWVMFKAFVFLGIYLAVCYLLDDDKQN